MCVFGGTVSASINQRVSSRLMQMWNGDRLMRGFGLLGLGEIVVRLSRLGTAIVLARMLGPIELGIAATAITCFELIRILANNGIGQTVIRAREDELEATCNRARQLIWLICLGMALLQFAAGCFVTWYTGRTEFLWLIACLSGVFVLMPPGMVQAWLLQRDQRMGTIAAILTTQVGIDNLITALLALSGFGAWSIVLPKLLTTPIWLIGVRRSRPWVPKREAGLQPVRAMVQYSAPILASEILVAVRLNADKLLVAAFLGVEALGIYYFAFSAGYGLTLVLTGALVAASFPHLADPSLSREQLLERFDHALSRLALPICALISLQALAIIVYVPLLFGAKWEPYIPVVAVLCLSAVTKPCFDLASQLLRAAGLTVHELAGGFIFTAVLLGFFTLALPFGLLAAVIIMAIVTISLQVAFAIWARHLIATAPLPSRSEQMEVATPT